MKASEALKQLRAKGSLDEMLGLLMGEPIQRAIESLEREAEREEQERPMVTLKHMADSCDAVAKAVSVGSTACLRSVDESNCKAAAATLRKLDEEGGKFLQEVVLIERLHMFLRSLGVEKKP